MLNLIKQKIKEKLYLKLAFGLNDYYIDRYLTQFVKKSRDFSHVDELTTL